MSKNLCSAREFFLSGMYIIAERLGTLIKGMTDKKKQKLFIARVVIYNLQFSWNKNDYKLSRSFLRRFFKADKIENPGSKSSMFCTLRASTHIHIKQRCIKVRSICSFYYCKTKFNEIEDVAVFISYFLQNRNLHLMV